MEMPPPFRVTCYRSVLPSYCIFFFLYIQSDPDKPQDVAIAPTCHYWEEGPLLSLQLPFKSSGQELNCRMWHQFPFLYWFCVQEWLFVLVGIAIGEESVLLWLWPPQVGNSCTRSKPCGKGGKVQPMQIHRANCFFEEELTFFLPGLILLKLKRGKRIQELLTSLISIKDYKELSSDWEALMQVPSLPYNFPPLLTHLKSGCCLLLHPGGSRALNTLLTSPVTSHVPHLCWMTATKTAQRIPKRARTP